MARLIWSLLKPLLFLFDAEKVHRLSFRFIQFLLRVGGKKSLRIFSSTSNPETQDRIRIQRLNMEFFSYVGLAAGFDKDAEWLRALPHLGFGFAEIGTVTPRPQPGNEVPRLFRNSSTQAVFNRMGFNSRGARIVSQNLAEARVHLPSDFRVGVNIGKNKETPNEYAHLDYADAVSPFEGLADYIVVNVSSPNTPGLRELQSAGALRLIFDSLREKMASWRHLPPVLVKLAPELSPEDIKKLVSEEKNWGISGWVLTNTRAGDRDGLPGGWSGEPLREVSRHRLQTLRSMSELAIISVGGIMDAGEAKLRMELGADLIQIYSGWIFGGPTFPGEIAAFLSTKKNSRGI